MYRENRRFRIREIYPLQIAERDPIRSHSPTPILCFVSVPIGLMDRTLSSLLLSAARYKSKCPVVIGMPLGVMPLRPPLYAVATRCRLPLNEAFIEEKQMEQIRISQTLIHSTSD